MDQFRILYCFSAGFSYSSHLREVKILSEFCRLKAFEAILLYCSVSALLKLLLYDDLTH